MRKNESRKPPGRRSGSRRLDGMAPQTVADQLGVRVSQVYLAKHRVQKLVQEEIRAMEGAAGGRVKRRLMICDL